MAETEPTVRDTRRDGLLLVAAMVAFMWFVEVIDSLDSHRLDGWGIRPHHVDRLVGIVFAPFLHVSFGHLLSNTVPFLAMGCAIALGGAARVVAVTAIVVLIGGAGTWLIGPSNSVHIGASGVVFGYAAYLIARGVYSGRPLQLAMGGLVGAIWGTALLASLIPRDGISWQGHLCGAIGGVVAAALLDPGRRARRAADASAAGPRLTP
jgi:membrane associated rhomboid family serine protease